MSATATSGTGRQHAMEGDGFGAPLPGLPTRNRLLGQIARLATARVAAAALSAAWFVVAARHLPMAAFGDLSLLLALGLVFAAVADFGLGLLLADTVAVRPTSTRSALLTVIRIRLGLGVVSSIGVAVGYLLAAHDGRILLPLVFSGSMLATTVYSSITAALRGLGRVGPEVVNEVASRLGLLIVGWTWLASGGGLLAAVVAYATADVVSAVALSFPVRQATAGCHEPVPPGQLTLRRAAPLAVSSLVGTLYYRIDIWLLSLLVGPAPVALYASSYRVFDALTLPSNAIAMLSVPSTAGMTPVQQRRRLFRLSVLAAVTIIPVAIAVAVFAEPLLGHLYGQRYAVGSGILRVLLIGALPSAVVAVIASRAAMADGRRVARALGSCLVLDIVLNLVLVPRHGVMAAAWATVGCQIVLTVLLARGLVAGAHPEPRGRPQGEAAEQTPVGPE